jgi:toxin CcdB
VDLPVVVQADIFDRLDSRLAIPLLPQRSDRRAITGLNPVFEIEGKRYVLYTQHMLAVPVEGLKQKIANLADHRDEIVSAVDFLQQGF